MKLKKLLTITLGIGSCLCLLSCGDNKEKESSSESKTVSSTIVESSKEEIQSSSTNNQESSLNTESSETVESQNETSSLIESSSDVSDEWTLITYEEFYNYCLNKQSSNYNFCTCENTKGSEKSYSYLKIENGKYYSSTGYSEKLDIYNYDFGWSEIESVGVDILTTDLLNYYFSSITKNGNGYYTAFDKYFSFEKNDKNYRMTFYNLDMTLYETDIYDEFFYCIVTERPSYEEEPGKVIPYKKYEEKWETVDLTKVNGHIAK